MFVSVHTFFVKVFTIVLYLCLIKIIFYGYREDAIGCIY